MRLLFTSFSLFEKASFCTTEIISHDFSLTAVQYEKNTCSRFVITKTRQ